MKPHFVYIGLRFWSCYRRPRLSPGRPVGFGETMQRAYADLLNQENGTKK